ncbi:MAG: amidohydrolase, partial [Saprospiraceae bacterium]|nr:amidohydrolase [Saprospiraceae bacterium]
MISPIEVKKLTETLFEEVVACRRYLHQHPELSFQESETARYIENFLMERGIKSEGRLAENGIVYLIKGLRPGSKVVALRADIDALPIQEQNDVSYKSK